MEEYDYYDPRQYERSVKDFWAAWAVCALILGGILLFTSANAPRIVEDRRALLTADLLHNIAELRDPGHQNGKPAKSGPKATGARLPI